MLRVSVGSAVSWPTQYISTTMRTPQEPGPPPPVPWALQVVSPLLLSSTQRRQVVERQKRPSRRGLYSDVTRKPKTRRSESKRFDSSQPFGRGHSLGSEASAAISEHTSSLAVVSHSLRRRRGRDSLGGGKCHTVPVRRCGDVYRCWTNRVCPC